MNDLQIDNSVHLKGFVHFSADPTRFPIPFQIGAGYELCELVTAGCVLFEEDGREIECTRGSLFWHVPGDYTICRYKEGMPYSCVAFRFEMKTSSLRKVPRYTIWEQTSEIEAFVKQTWASFNDENFDLTLLSQYIYTTLFWKAYSYSKTRPKAHLPLEIQRSIAYIDNHSGKIKSIDEIAKEASVSVSHLHFLFKKHLSDTPHHYLMNKRMQEARNFLVTTNTPIKKICSLCGFVSVENFCRQFKRNIGVSPSQYRERHTVLFSERKLTKKTT